jgi:DNA repair exonuclease SbcCD ATPase subunit
MRSLPGQLEITLGGKSKGSKELTFGNASSEATDDAQLRHLKEQNKGLEEQVKDLMEMLDYWKAEVHRVEEHFNEQADKVREQALKEIERKVRESIQAELTKKNDRMTTALKLWSAYKDHRRKLTSIWFYRFKFAAALATRSLKAQAMPATTNTITGDTSEPS